ncbi:MAG: nucleotidyltransferase domain-containing protein [Candidatus Margulisbacteria bacterium]|nr:nucleotidyltransferase domain-containing protein [Candidatus Margulisiibacteriota bacterium]
MLSGRIRVKEMVLFGSQASGRADRFSDIDLVVISPDFEGMKYEQIISVFVELALKCDPRLEFHPFTLKERAEARPTNFLGHVLATGKVVVKDSKLLI